MCVCREGTGGRLVKGGEIVQDPERCIQMVAGTE